jgi:murein DD-endopeptidase MepM/ murein hydrolase activator NlpD
MGRPKIFTRKDNDRSLLILSPEGKPLRSIKLGLLTIVLLFIAAVCGITAIFMPSAMFRIRNDEGYKKIHLNEQNKLLKERIAVTSPMIKDLDEEIGSLDRKKDRVSSLLGGRKPDEAAPPKPRRSYADRLHSDPEKLIGEITQWEAIAVSFMSSMGKGNLFDTIPVCRPVFVNAAVSQPFGKVNDPFTNKTKWHYGIDYAASQGIAVITTAAGQVVRAETDAVWGKRVIIRHGRGLSTKYAHLGSVVVRRGQKVERGEVIGTIGISGLATGPHVHYELWYNGHPVNPEEYYFPYTATIAAAEQ